jgi:signal transduction histidine kinase
VLGLQSDTNGVELFVEDNGTGFDPSRAYPGHLGLRSMRERAARLDGTLKIESTPRHGTRISAWIPRRSK